jgi:hypothetical protein
MADLFRLARVSDVQERERLSEGFRSCDELLRRDIARCAGWLLAPGPERPRAEADAAEALKRLRGQFEQLQEGPGEWENRLEDLDQAAAKLRAAVEAVPERTFLETVEHHSPVGLPPGPGPWSEPAEGEGGRRQPYIPTQLQERVLRALDGKALTLDSLHRALKTDRKRLHHYGLKPLMQAGCVKNNRRVGGYYRPDAPPPKYAALLRDPPGNQSAH